VLLVLLLAFVKVLTASAAAAAMIMEFKDNLIKLSAAWNPFFVVTVNQVNFTAIHSTCYLV